MQQQEPAQSFRTIMATFQANSDVKESLLTFVRTIEEQYKTTEDITLFVFSLRCFFSWHKAFDLLNTPDVLEEVRKIWILQNEKVYSDWLASMDDNPATLKWEKWSFQAKMAILDEFMDCRGKPADSS